MLLTDASADDRINKILFGDNLLQFEFKRERNAHITQVTSNTFSTQSITGLNMHGVEFNAESAKSLRKKMAKLLAIMLKENEGDIFIACTKKAEVWTLCEPTR